MSRGFRAFRKPEKIEDEALKEALDRMDLRDRFIYWTGEEYKFRRESLRYNSLKALTVKKTPVPLADWIKLAARVVGENVGYDPASVKAGLYLHQGSKPAVFYELIKKEDGSYVSAWDCPRNDPPIKKGQVIIPAAAKEEPAQIEVAPSGKEIVETAPSRARRAARKGKATPAKRG